MPFGLRNAAQTFQCLMDQLLQGLPYAFVYLDDILVASRTWQEHLQHLDTVFSILQSNGLVINAAKCVFAKQQIEFLGHIVSAEGISSLPQHVAAIQDFLQPSSIQQVQRFLGLVNFYRRFLPGIAAILKPLKDSLQGSPKKLAWSEACGTAFQAAIIKAVPLAHPSFSAELSLATDASSSHVGAVLQQKELGAWKPLAFFSKKLPSAQQRYSTFDRELLAIFMAIKPFRFLLEGRQFHVITDHKPLTAALHRVSSPISARQQRHLAFIAEFTGDICHIPGRSNVVADTLSRPEAVHQVQQLQHSLSSLPGTGLDISYLQLAQD
jgi:RNase H-like domain found in reverse transcriptase/Reverse transcriptase (RNA-dependent DNA polymerase)